MYRCDTYNTIKMISGFESQYRFLVAENIHIGNWCLAAAIFKQYFVHLWFSFGFFFSCFSLPNSIDCSDWAISMGTNGTFALYWSINYSIVWICVEAFCLNECGEMTRMNTNAFNFSWIHGVSHGMGHLKGPHHLSPSHKLICPVCDYWFYYFGTSHSASIDMCAKHFQLSMP